MSIQLINLLHAHLIVRLLQRPGSVISIHRSHFILYFQRKIEDDLSRECLRQIHGLSSFKIDLGIIEMGLKIYYEQMVQLNHSISCVDLVYTNHNAIHAKTNRVSTHSFSTRCTNPGELGRSMPHPTNKSTIPA